MVYRRKCNASSLFVLCAGLICSPGYLEASSLLDGMIFAGYNGEKGNKLDDREKEEFIFENGRFKSGSCGDYNFAAGKYITETVGNAIHFKAVTLSPTHGKIEWQGVVDGNKLDATFIWTKERWYWDIHREYWFSGVLKE